MNLNPKLISTIWKKYATRSTEKLDNTLEIFDFNICFRNKFRNPPKGSTKYK